jgi:hypothetical protein
VVQPSLALSGCKKPSCLDRDRDPTDTSKVVANPRIAAGATVASSWLRLFPGTQENKHPADLKKLQPTLDSGAVVSLSVGHVTLLGGAQAGA